MATASGPNLQGLEKSNGVPQAMFALSLLNVLWLYLFFGLHRPDVAFVDIVALWTAILVVASGSGRRRTDGTLRLLGLFSIMPELRVMAAESGFLAGIASWIDSM